jgi:CheY-specific phosphatase CheX
MYTQFFGNYLLLNEYVTKEQLFSAMQRQANEHMKLGTLAIHAGYMDAAQVDDTVIHQTHQDRKFGELAVELGYLSDEQVNELLQKQPPAFLMLGQVLLDDRILTNADFEKIMNGYRSANGLEDQDNLVEQQDVINRLFNNYFQESDTKISHNGYIFAELLFNDFIRFIGDDFTPLSVEQVTEAPIDCCVKQEVQGEYSITTYISMDQETAIHFASHYVHEQFQEFDEYVQASLEDFLNLQNGLFTVNVSNDSSTELTLSAPESVTTDKLTFAKKSLHFPILYSFGKVDFYIEPAQEV